MKNSESLKEFKKLNPAQITEKIEQLRKDLFDLRFKQATRQLNETHKFKIIKKQVRNYSLSVRVNLLLKQLLINY